MTELYLEFLAQSVARDQAYSLLALYGVGNVFVGIFLMHLLERVKSPALADILRICLYLFTGGTLILHLAGLVILPLVYLD